MNTVIKNSLMILMVASLAGTALAGIRRGSEAMSPFMREKVQKDLESIRAARTLKLDVQPLEEQLDVDSAQSVEIKTLASSLKDHVASFLTTGQTKVTGFFGNVSSYVTQRLNGFKVYAQEGTEKVHDLATSTKENMVQQYDKVSDQITKQAGNVKQFASNMKETVTTQFGSISDKVTESAQQGYTFVQNNPRTVGGLTVGVLATIGATTVLYKKGYKKSALTVATGSLLAAASAGLGIVAMPEVLTGILPTMMKPVMVVAE